MVFLLRSLKAIFAPAYNGCITISTLLDEHARTNVRTRRMCCRAFQSFAADGSRLHKLVWIVTLVTQRISSGHAQSRIVWCRNSVPHLVDFFRSISSKIMVRDAASACTRATYGGRRPLVPAHHNLRCCIELYTRTFLKSCDIAILHEQSFHCWIT